MFFTTRITRPHAYNYTYCGQIHVKLSHIEPDDKTF